MKANLWAMVTASVFIGAGVLCGGCGKSDAQQVSETARTFMSGAANDDRTLVESTLTRLAREKMQENGGATNHSTIGNDGYTVGTPTIDGEAATIPVTVTERAKDKNDSDETASPAPTVTEVDPGEKTETEAATRTETVVLKLRREEGVWKIWALRAPLSPDGPSITMDFEHPEAVLGDVFKGMGEGLGAAMKSMGEGLGEGMGAMFKGMAKGMAEGAKAANEAAEAANKAAKEAARETSPSPKPRGE